MELSNRHSLFIGFKMESGLKRQLEAISGPEKKYVSLDDSDFLTICHQGGDFYVGKVVEDRLTTDRVNDVRRNVLSILQRLCPDTRLPEQLELWVCLPAETPAEPPALG